MGFSPTSSQRHFLSHVKCCSGMKSCGRLTKWWDVLPFPEWDVLVTISTSHNILEEELILINSNLRHIHAKKVLQYHHVSSRTKRRPTANEYARKHQYKRQGCYKTKQQVSTTVEANYYTDTNLRYQGQGYKSLVWKALGYVLSRRYWLLGSSWNGRYEYEFNERSIRLQPQAVVHMVY